MYAALVTQVAASLWSWRFELSVAGYVAGAGWILSRAMPSGLALGLVLWLVAGVIAVPWSRRALSAAFKRASLRRQWAQGVRLGMPSYVCLVPRVLSMRQVPAGDQLVIRVPAGTRVADYAAGGEAIAAVLGLRDIRVERDADHAGRARVTLVRRDPLTANEPAAWPHMNVDAVSAWAPIPVGVGEDGQPITIVLPERNVLLGGEPGAGKSAALSIMVATAALDPSTELWLFDGKLVELATWAGCARHTVGPDIGDAIDALARLRCEMDARYGELLANRARKITPAMGLPLHVVVIDELAFYLTVGDRKDRGTFVDLLRDLVARGRAAGIVVLAATQKPSSDIVPTSLRDLFGFRWALRCSTPQASDTILGSGWAAQDANAATIDGAQRGVGYLLHEGGSPVRLRSYYLEDAQLETLADRAEGLRRVPRPLLVTSSGAVR